MKFVRFTSSKFEIPSFSIEIFHKENKVTPIEIVINVININIKKDVVAVIIRVR